MTTRSSRIELPARLAPRRRQVLAALVRLHVQSGKPVSSAQVARALKLRWSPATIRSEMSDLESDELLIKAHSAAGRTPTALGYRVFIDFVLQQTRNACRHADFVQVAGAETELTARLRRVCAALADQSALASIVISEGVAHSALEHLHFARLAPRRVVALLATRGGAVIHKPLELDIEVGADEVDRLNSYVTMHFRGRPLNEVRNQVRAELERHGERARQMSDQALALTALSLAAQALDGEGDETELIIEGRAQLLQCRHFDDMERLRGVLRAMEEKDVWLQMLNASIREPGLLVHLGEPDLPNEMGECAIITAPFSTGDGLRGRVGILGPRRMDYPRVVALVRAAGTALE